MDGERKFLLQEIEVIVDGFWLGRDVGKYRAIGHVYFAVLGHERKRAGLNASA
jgi:hypothetical protein